MTAISRTIHEYKIVGYDAYFDEVLPKLQKILSQRIYDEDSYFIIAINEAVCNAARYSVYGYEEAQIKIELIITAEDITVTVESKTKPFDAVKYRDELKRLKEDPNFKDMPWFQYTGASIRSRGLWMIMMAVDYLYMESNGDKISLNISLPYRKEEITRTIGELVPRFYIEKDGVIS